MALPVPDYELHEPYATYAALASGPPEPDYLAQIRDIRVPSLPVEAAFDVFSAAAPEGWRVELIEGEIHVTPPANGEHEEIVSEAAHQMAMRGKDPRLRSYTGIGLFVPGASVTGKVEPDLVLAPKGSFADQLEYHSPTPALLVAEVTSDSTGDNDRQKKIRGYARAGIPVYLLIDREAGQAIVYTEPKGEKYTRRTPYQLSETVPLPDPLGFELDTAEF